MLSAVLLLSAVTLAAADDIAPLAGPRTGLVCAPTPPACVPRLIHEVPEDCRTACAESAACQTTASEMDAALASWPHCLRLPRTPRPLPCWQKPPCHWLDFFAQPISLSESLSHWERVIFGGISDTNLRLCRDYEHFYDGPSIIDRTLALGLAATFAHTSIDQEVRDWYQDQIRDSHTDRWARHGKHFGELYTIGIYGGVLLLGKMTEKTCVGSLANEWADRSLRSVAVGGPAVLTLQFVLGAARPVEMEGSHWRPFNDTNAVSGHAFLGAIPFLTAASMTENRLLRSGLMIASGWTAWSRINDDQHYLSQAMLGWFFAWQAVQSVNRTECEEQRIHMAPYMHPEGSGIAIHFRY